MKRGRDRGTGQAGARPPGSARTGVRVAKTRPGAMIVSAPPLKRAGMADRGRPRTSERFTSEIPAWAPALASLCMIAHQVGGKSTRDALFFSTFHMRALSFTIKPVRLSPDGIPPSEDSFRRPDQEEPHG